MIFHKKKKDMDIETLNYMNYIKNIEEWLKED
jgi:hypothetical protein